MKLKHFCPLGYLLSYFLLLACGGGPSEPSAIIEINIDKNLVDFGTVFVGAQKDIPVSISNQSTSTDTLKGNLSISGTAFSISAGVISFGLAPGRSQQVTLRFTPSGEGVFTGTFTISHNATNQSSPSQIPLNGTGDDKSSEINALIQSGWQAFEAKDYAGSEAKFDSAISLAKLSSIFESLQAEAESGRGWSRAKLRNFFSSKVDFTSSLSRSSRETSTDLNSKAGLAFVHHARNEFQSAIQRALEVLTSDPNYTFEHDSRVYHKSLRLVLAQSYYTVGDFQKAAEQLDILEPGGAPHSTDPDELLQKIQALWSTI